MISLLYSYAQVSQNMISGLPRRRLLSAIIIILAIFLKTAPGYAAQEDPPVPEGFSLLLSDPGVRLYRKNFSNGSPDYVQVVDLSQGASVLPLHGEITEKRAGLGVYGGSDARFRSKSLRAYWQEAKKSGDPFCVVNGQFFYMLEYPTRLPFSLKVNGEYTTDGYGIDQFVDQKLILELWPGRADIRELSAESLYTSTAPNIIAGITEEAPKRIKFAAGRTFVGVGDRDGDGFYETFYVFNSSLARQSHAADTLRAFGAAKVMHLDGGGSTQLLCEGEDYIYSERLIPQAIAIYTGTGINPLNETQLAYTAPPGSSAPARMDATPLDSEARLSENSTPETVAPAQTVAEAAIGSGPEISSPEISGDDSVVLPLITAILNPEQTQMMEQETSAPGLTESAAVFHEEAEPAAIVESPPQDITSQEQLTSTALKAPVVPSGSTIRITDIFIIPLAMSPVVLFLFVAIGRIRLQNY